MTALLIDLDGVIYEGDRVVAGSPKAVAWLTEQSIPHLFVTNTTSRPRSAIVDKLARLGVATTEKQIFTPPVAASTWLHKHGVSRVALFVPEATASEFDAFENVQNDSDAQAVVVGDLGEGWNFEVLNRAFRMLMHDPQPHLIALGMTRYWQAGDGLRLDTAPFVMALSHASEAKPYVLGKPARAFFDSAVELVKTDIQDTYMIGDDIRADIGGAQAAGLKGILVQTGKFRSADLGRDVVPDAMLASFAELPQWWKENVLT